MKLSATAQRVLALVSIVFAVLLGGATSTLLATCGPFTDTANDAFCGFILEVYYLAITTGTTPTTFDPAGNVTRTQMATFLSRTVDRTLQRGNRRAALKQFWTPQNSGVLGLTTVGSGPALVESDGADLWVPNYLSGTVSRVRGSDAKLLETWSGAGGAWAVLVAMGRVFILGRLSPGQLYQADPSQSAGAVTILASDLGNNASGIAFDGSRIWTANAGSVSIVTPGVSIPWTVTTVTTGFTQLYGALYDGANVWVADNGAGKLQKLDGSGAILETVTVGSNIQFPIFDGTNIWVPYSSNSILVVRASSGAVLATLTGNGLLGPRAGAFDGQRVLVANQAGNSVSLWKAADLTPLGSFATGASTQPYGACSDGVNFWITLFNAAELARF